MGKFIFDTYEGDVADCLLSGVQQRVMWFANPSLIETILSLWSRATFQRNKWFSVNMPEKLAGF